MAFWYRYVGAKGKGTIVLSAESELKGMMHAMRLLEPGESIVSSGEVSDDEVFGLWLDGGAARITLSKE